MSLETEVKSFIGARPISYFKVEGACAYDYSDPFFDHAKGSGQQFFADAYSMAMVDYYHKGQATPFANDVLVAILIRLTDKHERTELVHLRLLSDAYFAIPKMEHFAEAVVLPNTRKLSNKCRKLKPATHLEKCEAVVFETTQAEFGKIVRSVGGSNTIKTPCERCGGQVMSEANYHVDTDKAYSVFDPGHGKQKAFILSIDTIQGMEQLWEDYAKKTDTAILPYNPNPNNWIYCDERLPSNSDMVEILVAELDHGEKPEDENAHWNIEIDCGWFEEHDADDRHRGWTTVDDWDEGQPWAVVAWRQIPRCYVDKYDIRHRDIRWCNVEAK